jgi:hypothetical protein
MSPPIFEPEYGTEGSKEENAFNSGKCNYLFSKAGIGRITPWEGPGGLTLNIGDCLNGME